MFREAFAIFFAVGFGLAFCQAPVFIQEYEQRLGGAVGALTALADQYAENANRSDMTLEIYVQRHLVNADHVTRRTGRTMVATLERLSTLEAAREALDLAPRWKKPWVLVRHGDGGLLRDTWAKFGFTLTVDPLFGAAGVLFGFLFNRVLVVMLRPEREDWF